MRAYTSLSSSLSFSLLIISNINASHFLLLSNWLILSHVYIVVRSNSPKVKTCMNIRLWYLIGLFINSCISENILWNDFIKNYLAATCFGKQMVASAVRLKLNRLNVRTIHARERAGVGKNGKWECTHTHTQIGRYILREIFTTDWPRIDWNCGYHEFDDFDYNSAETLCVHIYRVFREFISIFRRHNKSKLKLRFST